MRYHKGYLAISEVSDIPLLLHVRNARAVCFDQLAVLLSLELPPELCRSLRWRVARLEQAGLLRRFTEHRHLGRPVFGITRQGLEVLESRGHCLLSLPSTTEQIFHPSQILHALESVNVRIALATGGVLVSWKSDLEIASRNLVLGASTAKDYDAIAEITSDGHTRSIGFEYERTPKAASRYAAIRETLERDQTVDLILYLAPNDDILYLLAMEMRVARKRIAFALSESFRRSLLDTRVLTNTSDSEIVPLRQLLLRANR